MIRRRRRMVNDEGSSTGSFSLLRRNHHIMIFISIFIIIRWPRSSLLLRCVRLCEILQFNGSRNNANVAIIEFNCSLCVSCLFLPLFYRRTSDLLIFSWSFQIIGGSLCKKLKQLTNKFANERFLPTTFRIFFRVG